MDFTENSFWEALYMDIYAIIEVIIETFNFVLVNNE